MPTSEKTAMKIFAVSRTAYSVVVVNGASSRGCLICTAMNSRPPAIAATAAARVSVVVVMAMSGSQLSECPRRVLRDDSNLRTGWVRGVTQRCD